MIVGRAGVADLVEREGMAGLRDSIASLLDEGEGGSGEQPPEQG